MRIEAVAVGEGASGVEASHERLASRARAAAVVDDRARRLRVESRSGERRGRGGWVARGAEGVVEVEVVGLA